MIVTGKNWEIAAQVKTGKRDLVGTLRDVSS